MPGEVPSKTYLSGVITLSSETGLWEEKELLEPKMSWHSQKGELHFVFAAEVGNEAVVDFTRALEGGDKERL